MAPSAQRPNIDAVVAYINQVGTPGDPIVSLSFFHNPLSELDVAVADDGAFTTTIRCSVSAPRRWPQQLAPLSGPNPQPAFFGLTVHASPEKWQHQAVSLARNGTIFSRFVQHGAPVSDANDLACNR